MAAKYILSLLAGVFLIMGMARSGPQSRTMLIIGTLFSGVSAWLWYRSR